MKTQYLEQPRRKSTKLVDDEVTSRFRLIFASLLLCVFALNLFGQTPVMFPLNQMFGGTSYQKNFTLQAAQSWITGGTNAYVGSSLTVTPAGNTNPIVYLTPNTYLVKFPDATYPWRIAVPNTTNLQNAINLSTGPLPTFLMQPLVPIVGGPGIIITNIGGTNLILADTGFLVINNSSFPVALAKTLTLGSDGPQGTGSSPAGTLFLGDADDSGHLKMSDQFGSYSDVIAATNGTFTFHGNGIGLTNLNLTSATINGIAGLNAIELVITNTTGPHGWTNFFGNGILTNRTPW